MHSCASLPAPSVAGAAAKLLAGTVSGFVCSGLKEGASKLGGVLGEQVHLDVRNWAGVQAELILSSGDRLALVADTTLPPFLRSLPLLHR